MATTNNLNLAQRLFIPTPTERENTKLRFWDTRDKVMLDWNTVRQTAFNRGDSQLFYSVFGDPHRFLQLECSGVPDNKRNFAYEGDVVKHSPHWQSKLEYSLVSRKKWGFFFPFGDGDWSISRGADFEIVGNIFENESFLRWFFESGSVRTSSEEMD